ncbi:MAG: HNH endonuclease [Chthoniobacter sp.]|nr:HNH endonuclease [Chthoniobacter sp.]
MVEAGEFPSRAFTRSPGLVLRFRSYGALVVDRWPSRLDLRLPFYHLSTQEFWEAYDAEVKPAGSPDTCAVCEMHPELYELLADHGFRLKARVVLITKYFDPTERVALFESLGIQGGGGSASSTGKVMEEAEENAKRKGRSARFAVRVCAEYRFTCALTGYRCVTGDGATIVDAAHIEAWATSQNDDPTNGLALSKNAHWMFDVGLWSADEDLRVIINAPVFTEHGPEAFRLGSFAGRHLQFDPTANLRPAREMLRQHRRRFGLRV